jgi:hypothetical protein
MTKFIWALEANKVTIEGKNSIKLVNGMLFDVCGY